MAHPLVGDYIMEGDHALFEYLEDVFVDEEGSNNFSIHFVLIVLIL